MSKLNKGNDAFMGISSTQSLYNIRFCVQVLTSAGEDTVDGPVTDGSVAGLNVHKRFAAHPHEHPLLHAKL